MTGNKIILEDLQQIIEVPIDWDRFSGKTILITGANGFIPAYLVEIFLNLCNQGVVKGTKILALVRNGKKAQERFKYYFKNKNLEFLVQDVCNPININQKIDFIIHAASQASPKYYGIDPVGTLTPNTIGTIGLLNLARTKQIEEFLYFSSSEVYGIADKVSALKEVDYGYLDPLNIRSCYAESKRMGETICISWHHQFNIPVKIVRPFHTYGPGMSDGDGRVFADFVFNIINNHDLVIRSNVRARRAYCYVMDAVLGYFYVLLYGINGEAYNVGNPFEEHSVEELANILIALFPEKSLKVRIEAQSASIGYVPSNNINVIPDITKVQKLGWSPHVDVETGFRRTILSYK